MKGVTSHIWLTNTDYSTLWLDRQGRELFDARRERANVLIGGGRRISPRVFCRMNDKDYLLGRIDFAIASTTLI